MPWIKLNFKPLLIGFALILFAAPLAGKAAPSEVKVNSDKTISINGKKTFPVYMWSLCNPYFESKGMTEPCDLSKNTEFKFDIGSEPKYVSDFQKYDYKTMHEQAGIFYNLFASQANSFSQSLIDSPSFFAWLQLDEAPDDKFNNIKNTYNNVKMRDQNHPVLLNHWTNMTKWAPHTDIISYDEYAFKNRYTDPSRSTYLYPREDGIYAYEYWSETNFFKGTNLNSITKPVWALIQATGVTDTATVYPILPKEVRANTYTAITMDVKGIGYWGYETWGGSTCADANGNFIGCPSKYPYGTSGLYNDATLHAYYKQLARELTSLNDILVLPTKDYSWYYRPGTNVTFSKTLTKTVLWKTRTNFNYLLKQQGSKYYLIVVNKDSRSISDVGISISGLSGSFTAKTLGLAEAGSVAKIIQGNNGTFTDSFNGYQVNIYQLTPGSLPAHCIDGTKNFDETDTDCGGADCGACFVPPSPTSSPSPISSSTPLPTATPTPATPYPSGAPITPPSPPPSAYVPPWEYGEFPNPLSFGSIYNLIGSVTGWILGIVASVILLMMIIGGLIYTTSAGDEERMAWAKKIVIAALIGFVVIILSAILIEELKKIL